MTQHDTDCVLSDDRDRRAEPAPATDVVISNICATAKARKGN